MTAAPKVPCWKLVLNDAYAGAFGQVYALSCYHQAIDHIPATAILIYSNMGDEIRNAEAAAANGRTYAIRHPQGARPPQQARGSSVPLPVLVLAGLAVVLLIVGGAGDLWRRTRRDWRSSSAELVRPPRRTGRAHSPSASARSYGSRISSRRGLATSTATDCAREIATFSRLREKRNSRLRGRSSPLEVAIEKKTTGASWPWNLSTVPIRARRPELRRAGSEPGRCRA